MCGLVSNGTFEIETREIGYTHYSQLREREEDSQLEMRMLQIKEEQRKGEGG